MAYRSGQNGRKVGGNWWEGSVLTRSNPVAPEFVAGAENRTHPCNLNKKGSRKKRGGQLGHSKPNSDWMERNKWFLAKNSSPINAAN
jgi:hypothetical protein